MLYFKKLLPALIFAVAALLITAPALGAAPVSAETENSWYRIEKQNVFFYKAPLDTSDNVLFCLEYTYFVKPVSVSGNFFQVQLYENRNGFVKMTGYVKSADLSVYTKTPAAPLYPEVSLTVTTSTTLKQTPASNGEDITAVMRDKAVMFYGRAAAPEWYYVRVDNDFGYIPVSKLSALNIPLHPVPLVEDVPVVTDPVDLVDPPAEGSPALEIILILLICIPALVIVAMLFLSKKNTPTKNARLQQPAHMPKYLSDEDYFDDLDLM